MCVCLSSPSGVCQSACKCVGLALMIYLSGVLLGDLAFCSPRVGAVELRIFDLRNLGLGFSDGASGRTQIHPIWRT